jgi:hypothetical protein
MKNMNTDESMYAAIGTALLEPMEERGTLHFKKRQHQDASRLAPEIMGVFDSKRETS